MPATNIPQLVQDDPWLEPYTEEIKRRIEAYEESLKSIKSKYGSLKNFAGAHLYLGFHFDNKKKGWWYREWAPGADALFLTGDFNDWNRESHPLKRLDGGVWEIFVPEKEGLKNGTKLKVFIKSAHIQRDRIPAYIRRVEQDPQTHDFAAVIWQEKEPFPWTDQGFKPAKSGKAPIIYEAHVGMAQETEGVGTFKEFEENVLPRIKDLGYNTVQLMAVKEHPYYGSFGYHVSNFFAASSRFGTPEDLKSLVNRAHELGIAVIMDMVHSHAVKNIAEGLNEFDGTENQYFHAGGRGYHNAWDSKLFNYGKEEVQQFLLSNVRFWLEEFHMDGFRFDGVTSMLYLHHGDHMQFDHYDKYFLKDVDWDALKYFQMANQLVKEIRKGAITIAEDMSGMPGLCRQVKEGGLGFDFRLGMGIPDFWIKYLKEKQDEDWNIHELWSVLVNRRYKEHTIAYAESHDQAIVGDKTLAFWLMDKEMYWHMHKEDDNLIIDRGMALHKMIRLFTIALGGEGYLTFIGNEFGHPEWIDFPREGNEWSYQYARRQWSLVDNPDLKYQYLNTFDKHMVRLIQKEKILEAGQAEKLNMDDANQVIIFKRGSLIFIFNFSPSNSIPGYRFWIPTSGKYKVVLGSDEKRFGGHGRVDTQMIYVSTEEEGGNWLRIYVPNRSALVLKAQ